ncbi:MAG: helix-turn-helix transcriptional regulator [Oscillospiraceae bacterium]|nr:helix-turn-helix transcriptional regulator [Oscillospiraceae bacterium]
MMENAREVKTFAKRLQNLREKRRISRCVLSELCGLSKNQISRYERGEQMPNADALCALAEFFGVSTDYLLCRDKEK